MQAGRYTFLAAIMVTIVAYLINAWTLQMPEVRPANAPAGEFSADRAFALESRILVDHMPHPNGSAANDRVRLRIERFLTANDIPWDVQRAWGCSAQYNRCGWVKNIIARIDGKRPHPYVALMAHYDSVPVAPGAGDDGAGFITMLETAKTLKAEGLHRNPLLVVLTDGEEMGLLGAEAFFRQYPLAKYIGVLVNVEGAGSSGPSQVLRTGGHDGGLISLYHRVAPYPFATSLTSEVFKHMPNDTDFSVALRHGVPGIEFAYAGEFNHYHTPNDNLANLDKRTLQHHGDNVLPLTRALLNTNLHQLGMGTNDVYMQTLGIWFQWPFELNWVLLVLAGVLLGLCIRRLPKGAGHDRWAIGLTLPFIVIVASCATGTALFILARMLIGTIVSWPAVLWPWRLMLFSAPLFGGLAAAWWVNRYVSCSVAIISAWIWWWILAALGTAVLPGASGILLAPLVAGSVCIAAASATHRSLPRSAWLAASVAVATTSTLGIVPWIEQTQGYRLFFVTFPFISLYALTLAPLVRGRAVSAALGILALLTVIGITGAVNSPLYSRQRPQHINIQYVEDTGGHGWYRLVSPNPPPHRMLARMDFINSANIFPWSKVKLNRLAAAGPSGWRPPDVKVMSDTYRGGTRHIALRLQLRRRALFMALILPDAARPKRFLVDDVPLVPHKVARGFMRGHYMITLSGMGEKPVTIKLELASNAPFKAWVTDASSQLPDSASGLLASRPPLAVPVNMGDEAVLINEIDL